MDFYTLWIINEISATSGQYFFWPRAGFWSWAPKDQSLKVSAYRNNFQIINDIWTLETQQVELWCTSKVTSKVAFSYD